MEFNNSIPIKKSWGQNFIIDKNTINKIIKIINPKINEHIIEIGPGKGALTFPLSKLVKKITAVEIDPMLTHFLKQSKIKKEEKEKIHPLECIDRYLIFFNRKQAYDSVGERWQAFVDYSNFYSMYLQNENKRFKHFEGKIIILRRYNQFDTEDLNNQKSCFYFFFALLF